MFVLFLKKDFAVYHLTIGPFLLLRKVMEKLLVNSMMLFLQSNHLISKNQFGFMSRRSTCSQLLATLNDWTLAVNNHGKVDAVYIDFAKALTPFLMLNC